MNQADFTQALLLYLVLQSWVFVGAADWLSHRVSHIESTSGPKESAIHLLMLAEAGAALLLGIRRDIAPIEQHIHDYLAVLPFMALSFVLVLHWPQALAAIGAGPEPARWSLGWKGAPLM
jgi:hypothetical protein